MATLVVGPFYLSGILGLSLVQTGLVMSVGPAVSALAGAPAGRLVDRFGAAAVAFCGLSGLITGASAMGGNFLPWDQRGAGSLDMVPVGRQDGN